MSASSASVGFWNRKRMTVPSSLVVIVPSPSLSNKEKASLNSAICSSVSWSAMVLVGVVAERHCRPLPQGIWRFNRDHKKDTSARPGTAAGGDAAAAPSSAGAWLL
eukprot:21105-Heterococcus_DN1.PRE.1